MQETESYLNQILKKRLGSVVSYGGATRNSQTVSRVPQKQEKVENMPTVFRKKHETVFNQEQTQLSQAQSQYLSMKGGPTSLNSLNSKLSGCYTSNEMPEERQTSSQRVEYMLISKRIQNKKDDEYTSPVVDVTKCSTMTQRQQENRKRSKISYPNTNRQIQSEYRNKGIHEEDEKLNYNSKIQSEIGSFGFINKSKRKKIFEK